MIDLVEVFGSVPERIFLAAAAYQTFDGGVLVSQGPEGDNDENLGPSEFLETPLAAIRDTSATGQFDRLDPARAFRLALQPLSGEIPVMEWPAVPGRTYRLMRAETLTGDPSGWTEIDRWTAPSGTDAGLFVLPMPENGPASFYTLELQPHP